MRIGAQNKNRSTFDGRLFDVGTRLQDFILREKTYGQCLTWCASFLLICFLISLAAGGAYIRSNLTDYLFMVEQAWRLQQGQVPYQDFISPIGPVYYFLIDIITHLSHGNAGAYRLTGFLIIPFLTPALLWLSWRRLPANLAILITIYFTLIPISPRELDGSFFDFAYLAIYNSLSLPLVAVVAIGSLFEIERESSRAQSTIDGIIIAAAISTLLALKMSHGFLSFGILAAGLIVRKRNRLSLIISLIFISAITTIEYALASDLIELHIQNIEIIGKANNLPKRSMWKLQNIIYNQTTALIAAVFAFWAVEKYRQYHSTKVSYFDLATAGLLLLIPFADAVNDHENTPALLPLLFVFLWSIAQRSNLPIRGLVGKNYRQIKSVLLIVPFFLWTGLPIINDSIAITFHTISYWIQPGTTWPSDIAVGTQISSLKIPCTSPDVPDPALATYITCGTYLTSVSQGVSELHRLHFDHSRIYDARFNSIFPWLLQAPSPKGVLAWLDRERTISSNSFPASSHYLNDVDVLMLSKLAFDMPMTTLFKNIYTTPINDRFELVSETSTWQIYRRKPEQ